MGDELDQKIKSKILVVDDNTTNIELLRRTLEREGYEVWSASGGQEALDLVADTLPDLVLLDIMMPDIDGYEVCERLKKDERTKDIPVVFISAKNEVEDIVRGLEVGGVDYVSKPFNWKEVLARVKNHLEFSRMVSILDEKNKNLTELAALKDKFFGLASHDLRGPLTAISGYSELIKEDLKNLPPKTLEEFIDSISKAATDMLRLLNDLLDISAIESGNLELNFHPESLKKLIEEEVRIQQEFANKKNITLKCDVENIPEFSLDRVRVGQVLDNLISNAIKFSPPGKQINIHLAHDNGDAKVSVEDQGPGISPEDQNKLFEAFQKLKAKPTGGESSFGLGLAITKKVIEAHQGKLDFESKPGQGTTFFFTLPMQTK